MNKNISKKDWISYRDQELEKLKPILENMQIKLEDKQAHISGERHLMSGFKLVLFVRDQNNQRLVLKVSSHPEMQREIIQEYKSRKKLDNLAFAYQNFSLPKIINFQKSNDLVLLLSEYIKQDKAFFEHNSQEQFFLTLKSLQSLESSHITTRSHKKSIEKIFGIYQAKDYLEKFDDYIASSEEELKETLRASRRFFSDHLNIIQKYSDFLTSDDFAPHNILIKDSNMYLLDLSSLRFGNKYEAWARFVNFMTIYNPELESYLRDYVKDNRAEDEYTCLRAMRMLKIAQLLKYYSLTLKKTEGDLHILNKKRLLFWREALDALLKNQQLDICSVEKYIKERDSLRSREEIERQKQLKQLF